VGLLLAESPDENGIQHHQHQREDQILTDQVQLANASEKGTGTPFAMATGTENGQIEKEIHTAIA